MITRSCSRPSFVNVTAMLSFWKSASAWSSVIANALAPIAQTLMSTRPTIFFNILDLLVRFPDCSNGRLGSAG